MQITTHDSSRFGQVVALVIVETAVAVSVFAFCAGKGDPTTRQQVVLMMVALVSNLVGLGSGLLVGGGGKTQQLETPNAATVTSSDSRTTTVQPSTPNEQEPTL